MDRGVWRATVCRITESDTTVMLDSLGHSKVLVKQGHQGEFQLKVEMTEKSNCTLSQQLLLPINNVRLVLHSNQSSTLKDQR